MKIAIMLALLLVNGAASAQDANWWVVGSFE